MIGSVNFLSMKFIKKSKVFEQTKKNDWWYSHTMAPTAIIWNNVIRVFVGAWDKNGISRITYIDFDIKNPNNILNVHDQFPILDIGNDGTFDENGVFPAHAVVHNHKIFLFYTGFQKGQKIPHYNFGGLAISNDGENFERYSNSPILDRADEGLFVRAGQSFYYDIDSFKTVYSAGNTFVFVGGKQRPTYNIYFQELKSPTDLKKNGKEIISANHEIEHGLGRPQIIKINEYYYVFYTRRMLNMKYFIGCSRSIDCEKWEKYDQIFSKVLHSVKGFDSEMIYFPSVVYNPILDKYLLFYCGNGFGDKGIGYMVLNNV